MNIFAIIGEALRALRLNRLRTGLTMLGMIIGVAAVVLMLAVGQGAQTTVNQAITSMGSNLFFIVPGATSSGALRSGAGAVQTLTIADAQAIANLPSIKATAPIITGTAQLNYGANNWSTSVTGVTPDYFAVRDWPVENGALFTEADLRSNASSGDPGQQYETEPVDDINTSWASNSDGSSSTSICPSLTWSLKLAKSLYTVPIPGFLH